jgi:endonuclease-8
LPEGDTIARAAARLRPLLIGEPLLEVRHRGAALRDLVGARALAIDIHGKHLWIRLDSGHAIHVHLGMEGRWTLISAAGLAGSPRRVASAALALVVRLGGALCLDAPTVQVIEGVDARDPARRLGLGPDVMARALDLDEILARATAPSSQARPLGEVLLDQRIAAGIGNVWKSELCFLERMNPRSPTGAFAPDALAGLYRRAARMMVHGMSAIRRITTTEVGVGPVDGPYWVYRRADRPCARCRATIVRILQGAAVPRSTYYCPACQVARAP